MGKVLPSQRLLKRFEEQLVFWEMNLSEIVRSGAQMMLQYALEREVTEALGRNYYENAPATTKEKGRRNGYESHRVISSSTARTCATTKERRGKSPSSLLPAIALMGREFFFISVSATENPTRTGRGSCRRW